MKKTASYYTLKYIRGWRFLYLSLDGEEHEDRRKENNKIFSEWNLKKNCVRKVIVRTWLKWRRPFAPSDTVWTSIDGDVHHDPVHKRIQK